ncbi:hypothetical protein RIR_jg16289.t1 [Rhizophagus irregularis DAOM 181602=DAOM 197198]|nr:hypothetical protein RIR_jg16289.t1 [Rhizophagus irregularis DAOM 181602=DAOM 197198]
MRLKQQIVNQEQHTRAHIINPTSRHDIATIEPLFRNCCHLISTKLYLIIPYSSIPIESLVGPTRWNEIQSVSTKVIAN